MVTPTSTSLKPSSSSTKYQRLCPLCLKDPKSSLKQSSGSSKRLTLTIKAAFLWHLLDFALDVFSTGGLLKVSATNFGHPFFEDGRIEYVGHHSSTLRHCKLIYIYFKLLRTTNETLVLQEQ